MLCTEYGCVGPFLGMFVNRWFSMHYLNATCVWCSNIGAILAGYKVKAYTHTDPHAKFNKFIVIASIRMHQHQLHHINQYTFPSSTYLNAPREMFRIFIVDLSREFETLKNQVTCIWGGIFKRKHTQKYSNWNEMSTSTSYQTYRCLKIP